MNGFDFLIHSRKFGMKLGLENMQSLATAIGNPEKKLKFIHIAGTNGKGSTASLCAQTLQEAGFRTGLFTSPHLISLTERIQINGTPLSEATLTQLLNEIAEVTRAWETPPTFFEILTACALLHFERENVEWIVWETGLGGRLDSTNIVTPAVSVITHIGFDHQEFLGETIIKIALEKAGIIKPGIPTVCGADDREALSAIHAKAQEIHSACIDTQHLRLKNLGIHDGLQHLEIENTPFQLQLLGEHQARNAATAYTVLHRILKISLEDLQKGFRKAVWRGRFQILRSNPPLVLDAAHNPSSIKTLVQTWKSCFGKEIPDLVFGVMGDKNYIEMIDLLKPIASNATVIKIQNPRTADPEKILPFFSPIPAKAEESLASLWPHILTSPRPILITGSLFLVGEALQLHLPTSVSPPAQLNELLKPSLA